MSPQEENVSLKASANSWVARQALRRSSLDSAQDAIDEEIVRKMKSILNKLTVEKFPTLSKQVISCGIETTAHLDILVGEIVAKATTQHHFINMYADLCAMLHAQTSNPNVSGDSNRNVKKLLLNACQSTFERHLATLCPSDAEESEEAKQLYKLQMIGNIKFVGALLVRKMLASKVMFYIFEELLSQASLPEALECFVTLLAAVGPEFDHPQNQGLAQIFDQAETIINDAKVTPRIRYLFKDVLDLRASGWEDSKPKALERPTTLEEVAQKFHADAHTKSSSQTDRWGSADSVNSQEKCGKRQVIVVEDTFDKAAMHKEIASVFADMLRSRDVRKAVSRIATIGVPPHVQVEQLRDLLQFMTEMKVECVRAIGFEFIVTIFIEHYWMPSAFEEGFLNFARLIVDRRAETPALRKVIHDEMIPAFSPLVNRGILSSSIVQDLLRRLRHHRCNTLRSLFKNV
jgi:translation initiation factor 4G